MIPPNRNRYPMILNPADSCPTCGRFAIQKHVKLNIIMIRPATTSGL